MKAVKGKLDGHSYNAAAKNVTTGSVKKAYSSTSSSTTSTASTSSRTVHSKENLVTAVKVQKKAVVSSGYGNAARRTTKRRLPDSPAKAGMQSSHGKVLAMAKNTLFARRKT